MDCPQRIHSQIGNYMHPILYPDHFLPFGHPFTFKERVFTTVFVWVNWFFQYHVQYPKEDKIARKHFGSNTTNLQQLEQDMSLLILNVNPVIQKLRPTGMNTIFIGGGLHIGKPKPLPEVSTK